MKNLTEFIKESLVVNEANQLLAWTFDHYNPEILNVDLVDKDAVDYLEDGDCSGVENVKSRYVYVEWNDEHCYVSELGNNIGQYWKKLEKTAADILKGLTENDDWEWDNGICYINSDIMREYYKWEDLNPKVLVEYLKEIIINSYVDGDSNSCRAILDLQKREVILKGSDYVEFTDLKNVENYE